MVKELTVAEISEALGYEVKVVKEQPLNIPRAVYVGQVYKIQNDKWLVAAIGDHAGMGLTSVGTDNPGCWSSRLILKPITSDELKTKLIEWKAKYLGEFNDIFKTNI